MGIRLKILSGFLILVFMLIVAGLWSVYELKTIGVSVEKLLDENYKSINAARLMTEALERQDSGILLLVSGNVKQGIDILRNSDAAFNEAFKTAQGNVTIPGEETSVTDVRKAYDDYNQATSAWLQSVGKSPANNSPAWYFEQAHPKFLKTKKSLEHLMMINQSVMYETATGLHERANRALMPGVVALVSALVFTFLFNYLINYYMVDPIIRITNAMRQFQDTGRPVKIRVETHDEIEQLSTVLQNFTQSHEQDKAGI